ncbi:hypothetical protein PRNP1_004917 [Phytophthora ramorum]
MRLTRILLLVAFTCVASWGTLATAESYVQIKNLAMDPLHQELTNEGHRYLKGGEQTTETDEERVLGLGKAKRFFSKLIKKQTDKLKEKIEGVALTLSTYR